MKLMLSALTKALLGFLLMALLLFLPAGTWGYPGAWLLAALLFIPMAVLGVVLGLKAPELLRKRLNMRERARDQQKVVALAGLMLILGFVAAGLDYRFGWSRVSTPAVVIASILFLVGYGMYAEVLRENAWLSRTVEVMEGQQVVSTGLYGMVRHPMYTATLLIFLTIPLVLGSWWALPLFLPYPGLMVMRIRGEEALLRRELPGYEAYTQKVRWRMVPYIW